MALAARKDAGIDLGVLAWLLADFPVTPLPLMLVPLHADELRAFETICTSGAVAGSFRSQAGGLLSLWPRRHNRVVPTAAIRCGGQRVKISIHDLTR